MGKAFDILPGSNQKKPASVKKAIPSKKTSVFLYIIIVVAVIVTIVNLSSAKPKSENNSQEKTIPKQTQSQTSQTPGKQTTSTENYPSGKKSALPTSNAETNDSSSPDNINKAAIKIKILNATGKSGVAKEYQEDLETEGFNISSIATANNIYQQSVVYYQTQKEAEAHLVQGYLTGKDAKLEENSDLVGDHDLLIVIGKK